MEFIRSQFGNLSIQFYALLFSICTAVCILSSLSGGDGLSIFVAFLGISYVFFAGQGRRICFCFGIMYSLLYSYIAYEIKLYGDVMLNLFFIPINIAGLFLWKKNQTNNKITIISLSFRGMIFYAFLVGILTYVYGLYLQNLGASFAYLNAFSVVAQIIAFYLQVKRYVQNYLLVTLANIVSILIWWLIYDTSKEQIAQLLNMIIFFIMGVYYYIQWRKEAR